MMKAGTYYVGDLCYVLDDVWDEVCNFIGEDTFTLKDGRICSWQNTAYGDGEYYDQEHRAYAVDSGTIGCTLLEGLDKDSIINQKLGHIIEFDTDFAVSMNSGVIEVGSVHIDTEESGDDDEDEDDPQDNCSNCGDLHPEGVLEDGLCPSCCDEG